MSKYDNVMLATASLWAKQSKCKRRQVGAVIARDGRIISVGYNGLPSGYTVDGEDVCEKQIAVCPRCESADILQYEDSDYRCSECDLRFSDHKVTLKTMHELVIHAEANAILFAAKEGISTRDCTLYVTTAPCSECAKMIIQSGITRVVYRDEYTNGSRDDGLDLMRSVGIIIEKGSKNA